MSAALPAGLGGPGFFLPGAANADAATIVAADSESAIFDKRMESWISLQSEYGRAESRV
jgi:hypothetical protein